MENKYLTVSALNRYLKAKLENDVHLNRIFITGELSNITYHNSGHCYFTLKDEHSRISAIIFRTQLKKVLFKLEDGMKVLAVCRLSVYEPQGTYQLYVEKIDIDGLGNLYMAYEKRRLLLEKEGLFSQEHKLPIPKYATDIGIITASTGAAIHDIVRTIRLKCPSAKMTLYPSLVQGEEASGMLVKRLIQADQNKHDVIIIGRGGGSLEDLWAFNDETLARTIYECHTPIISGVGHESDVTICDFVADLRAATPTAAANATVFNQKEFENHLNDTTRQLYSLMKSKIQTKKTTLDYYKQLSVFKYPERYYQNAMQRTDDLSMRLNQAITHHFKVKSQQLTLIKEKLYKEIDLTIYGQNQMMVYHQEKLLSLMKQQLRNKQQLMVSTIQQLNAYNPLNVLQRGFTLTLQDQEVITSKHQVDPSKPLTIRFSDGDLMAMVKENDYEEKNDL